MSHYKRAKVTIDAYAYEATGLGYIYLSTDGTVDTQFGGVSLVDGVDVEYTPEPIIFADGDILYTTVTAAHVIRRGGVWYSIERGQAQVREDSQFAGEVAAGEAHRVKMVQA